MRPTYTSGGLLLSCFAVLLACGQRSYRSSPTAMQPPPTEKFALSAAPCTVEGYWVTIQGGQFTNAQGKGFPVPSGHTLRGSWGASGTSWLVGDELQPVPERLELLWFAYAENKFYEGDFTLPQAKIYALLKQGYWDAEKNRLDTYNEFTVCTLPKGVVVVWLTGGNQTLIGRFQAKEASPSAAAFAHYYGDADRTTMVRETQHEMPAAVQQVIAAHRISTSKWDEYLTTYPWQVAFNVPFALDQRYTIRYANAEYSSYPLTRDLAPYNQLILTPTPKPVPRSCTFVGKTEHGAHYKVRVRAFDEAETQAAFHLLHQTSATSPITLLFTLDKPLQKVTLSLKNEMRQIPLTKTTVEVLSLN